MSLKVQEESQGLVPLSLLNLPTQLLLPSAGIKQNNKYLYFQASDKTKHINKNY